ncbi:MAG: small, acid-soluble spore protein, alpha/beta type [Lachnospiraceae bacterium]
MSHTNSVTTSYTHVTVSYYHSYPKTSQGGNQSCPRTSTNTAAVPEAKGALDRFKFEVANELGVPLSDGYNGNLTSKQNGSVGGYMVKKMIEDSGKTDEPGIRLYRQEACKVIECLRAFIEHF